MGYDGLDRTAQKHDDTHEPPRRLPALRLYRSAPPKSNRCHRKRKASTRSSPGAMARSITRDVGNRLSPRPPASAVAIRRETHQSWNWTPEIPGGRIRPLGGPAEVAVSRRPAFAICGRMVPGYRRAGERCQVVPPIRPRGGGRSSVACPLVTIAGCRTVQDAENLPTAIELLVGRATQYCPIRPRGRSRCR